MASNKLDDLLVHAIEEIADLENFPSDWRDWAYWDNEKMRHWNEKSPSPYDLTRYVRNVSSGKRQAGSDVFVFLLERIFHGSEYSDVRSHPLWELTHRISQHPNLKDSDREEFFHYCSDENLYLKTFSFEFLLLEMPEGKDVKLKLSVPENTEQDAEKRAQEFMDSESDRLAERSNLQPPYVHDLTQTLSTKWASEPKKNAPVRILSSDRV